jgi:hypothetical protein
MVSRETQVVVRQARGKLKHQGSSAADVKRLAERRERAWSLRMAGATLQDIVNAGIGYQTQQMVSKDLKKARENYYQEDIESLLILDLARIDEMQKICTAALRMGNTSEVRNIMALMQFRRETLGITEETIQERRASTANVVNNGIMVVQGSTRDYLAGVMQAAGLPEEDISQELRELEVINSEVARAETQTRVIQGEVVEETGGNGHDSSTTSDKGKKKSGPAQTRGGKINGKRKVVLKRASRDERADQPGSSRPAEAPVSDREAVGAPGVALGDSILLGELVEARARQLEHRIEHLHEPGLGDLSSPAIIPADLATNRELAVPIKLPDANVPVSPGVPYKNAPRKLTHEEGTKEVARRLKRPATVDRVRTRVHEEEI